MKVLFKRSEKAANSFKIERQCYNINETFTKYDKLTSLDLVTKIEGKEYRFELNRNEILDLIKRLNDSLNGGY
jgi:transcriptional regulator NrdR family protein